MYPFELQFSPDTCPGVGLLDHMAMELVMIKRNQGTSLVVQWVRLHTPTAGGLIRSLVMELDPACMPQLRSRVLQLGPSAAKINK